MNRQIKLIILLIFPILIFAPRLAYGGEYLEVSKDFTLFTSKNLQGFLKPLFTTIGESFNSNLYSTALYENQWSIGLDISVNGMFIPDAHKHFDAELPIAYGTDAVDNAMLKDGKLFRQIRKTTQQPTLYGGSSYAIFSAPQNPSGASFGTDSFGNIIYDSTFKSVAFAEGNNVDFIAGVPVIQLIGGFPFGTQLRLRFWTFPLQDEMMTYWAGIINQRFDHFFDLFGTDTTMGLALNFAYHSLNRGKGFDINSLALGLHFSKSWDIGFTLYAGLQYENLSGEFKAIRDTAGMQPNDVANNPYIEVRERRPIEFKIESFSNFRFLGGISYRASIFELHADAAWASQPILTCGLTIWIAEWGRKYRESVTIERYEEIERIERIKRKEIIKE